jgi:hypothetical protein
MNSKEKDLFEKQMNHFFNEIIWLNLNIIILTKIIRFPWKELRIYISYRHFVDTLYKNYLEYSIVIIRKIYFDNGSGTVTLRKLKNGLCRTLTDEKRKNIKEKTKAIETELQTFEEPINNLRNDQYAHIIKDFEKEAKKNYSISFKDLKRVGSLINDYYRVLGDIGSKTTYILVPSEYADSLRNDYEPDIDRILNKIALDSELFTLYETDKDLWDAYERSWQKENSRVKNLKVINHYRNKLLNLPSIR